MTVKKVTYEEALARFKHSLEVKRAAERRIAEEWARSNNVAAPAQDNFWQ